MLFSSVTVLYTFCLFLNLPVALSSSPRTIYQFPKPTWVENILALRNGSLLVSLLNRPELHMIHPFNTPPTSSLVYTFPETNAVSGITELEPDVFSVTTTNFSITEFAPTPGTSQAWKFNFSGRGEANITHVSKASKIANIKAAAFLNGAAALDQNNVLLADCVAGNIIRLDIRTGDYRVVLSDTSMTIPANVTGAVGVNGLKFKSGYLYYSNAARGTLHRVRVSQTTGSAVGPFEKITDLSTPDDFSVLDDGSVFVAQPIANQVARVTNDGVVPVAGNLNSSAVAGVTSVTFGRTWRDLGTIYVSTTGAITNPVNGTFTEGGKVVAIAVD